MRVFQPTLCYLVRATHPSISERELVTNGSGAPQPSSNRLANVFTDVQFWVPVVVLLAGRFLLEWIR